MFDMKFLGFALVIFIFLVFYFRAELRNVVRQWISFSKRNFSIEGIDRTISGGIWKQLGALIMVIFLFLLVFMSVSSICGVSYKDSPGIWGRLGSVYCHFLDPGGLNQETTTGGIIMAFLITLAGSVLMSGILISTISNIIERRVDDIKSGQVSYDLKNHILIIGYDKMTIGLIRQLAGKDKSQRFLIQTIQDVPTVRHDLLSHLDEETDKRVMIMHGGRNSEEDLAKLNILGFKNSAKNKKLLRHKGLEAALVSCDRVFILGENDEDDHDSLNVECVKKIALLRKKQICKAVCLSVSQAEKSMSDYFLGERVQVDKTELRELALKYPLFEMTRQLIERYADLSLKVESEQKPDLKTEYELTLKKLTSLYGFIPALNKVPADRFQELVNKVLEILKFETPVAGVRDDVSGIKLAEQSVLLSVFAVRIMRPQRCNVLFEYQSTFALFQGKKIHPEIGCFVDFVPFNFYEMWAQKVLVGGIYQRQDGTRIDYRPLDREELTDKFAHFVVVGASRMGVAMMIEAARVAHFANFKDRKTRITLIDEHAREEAALLKSRYASFFRSVSVYYDDETVPHAGSGQLGSYLDIEFHFLEGRIESDEIRDRLAAWAGDPGRLLTIAVCFNQPPVSLAAGIYLPDAVYRHKIPVLVRQEVSCSVLTSLESSENDRFEYVRPFGMIDDCYDVELKNDEVPRLVHYIYCNYGSFDTKYPTDEELGAYWNGIDVVYKWSNRYHADTIPVKLRAAGYTNISRYEKADFKRIDWSGFDKHVELLARIEHNRWNIERLLAGFDVLSEKAMQELKLRFGQDKKAVIDDMYNLKQLKNRCYENREDKDLKNRIKAVKKMVEGAYFHDCIVPFEDLSIPDQNSDRVISKGIPWIVSRLT